MHPWAVPGPSLTTGVRLTIHGKHRMPCMSGGVTVWRLEHGVFPAAMDFKGFGQCAVFFNTI